ncbi:MAG TPA: hypothetical protein VM925_08800 [Labilithrix sp.]|nr:hypothetical protein [Labilithrix sp.]
MKASLVLVSLVAFSAGCAASDPDPTAEGTDAFSAAEDTEVTATVQKVVANDGTSVDAPVIRLRGLEGAANELFDAFASAELPVTESAGEDVRFEFGGIRAGQLHKFSVIQFTLDPRGSTFELVARSKTETTLTLRGDIAGQLLEVLAKAGYKATSVPTDAGPPGVRRAGTFVSCQDALVANGESRVCEISFE